MEGFNIVLCDRKTCEVLIVKISEPEVILVVMYRPPNASTSVFNDIIKQSENTIRDLDSPLPEIIIMDDFNFPGMLWDTAINSNNVNISGLVGLRDYLYLDQMITEPTRELNSLESTGDNGRQPPLLPPRLRATRVDTIIHNYRLSAAP